MSSLLLFFKLHTYLDNSVLFAFLFLCPLSKACVAFSLSVLVVSHLSWVDHIVHFFSGRESFSLQLYFAVMLLGSVGCLSLWWDLMVLVALGIQLYQD